MKTILMGGSCCDTMIRAFLISVTVAAFTYILVKASIIRHTRDGV